MAMTATSTRSTRRAEGVAAHSLPHTQPLPHQTQRATRQLLQQSNSGRPLKRLHEATNLAYDIKSPKKAKFEIEIPSKTQYQARLYPENHQRPARVSSTISATTHNKPPKHDRQPTTAPSPPQAPEPLPQAPAPTLSQASKPSTTHAKGLTKHREKVVNGIKHELDRLQPNKADAAASSGQGRKLRSQEGVRYKSELSAYFPEYDEVIGNIPKEQPTFADILTLDTPILIVETSPSSSAALPIRQPHSSVPSTVPIRTYGNDLFTKLNDSQIIDLTWLERQWKGKALIDPLPDSYYEPIHRKESRNEKITRNAERGRSQHEKEQVIRLLDGLRGPDWLKTMGVSGVTDTKKKQFEPARVHFVNKCEAVLEKFRKWTVEEKRLKLERDRAAKESRASQEAGSPQDDVEEGEDEEFEDKEDEHSQEANEDQDEVKQGSTKPVTDPPDTSDVDASAKQLHEEAMARSRMTIKSTRRRPVTQELLPPPPFEFKSFFKKPYQRDAALNKSRRRGRTSLAWGQPIPELEQQDFDLPEEFRDEEMLKARARRLRRLQRGNKNKG